MSQASKRASSLADRLRNEWETETEGKSHASLTSVFAEEPVNLSYFVSGKEYMAAPTLSEIQFDFVRHFEQVLYPETYIQMVEEFGEHWAPVRYANEFAVEWGKGSGKDLVCQMGVARVSNVLLCLKDPHVYFNLPHHAPLHLLNVAASAPQAHGVFFRPLRNLLVRSKWFKTQFLGDLPGPQAKEMHLQKQIDIVSGHSNAETLEGKNLIVAIADEISAFPTLSASSVGRTHTPAKTAEGIIDMLRSSATTRFPHTFKLAQISYPRFKGDAIEQAIKISKDDIRDNGEKSVYYASGPYSTWEVNPRYDNIERITVAGSAKPVPNVPSIVKDYEKNPAYARAKYECLPELAENRFFQNNVAIAQAFEDIRIPPPLEVSYIWGAPPVSQSREEQDDELVEVATEVSWRPQFTFASDLVPYYGATYAIHCDMAITGDKAGIAMSHVTDWQVLEVDRPMGDVLREQRPIVKVDFVSAFEADAGAVAPNGSVQPREIQVRWFRQLVYQLIQRGFRIGWVSMDGFQSADTLQILAARGLKSEKFSTDRSNLGYDTMRDVMYDGRLKGYWDDELVTEISQLNRQPSGKIDHLPDGSKDKADAVCGSIYGAIQVGGGEGPQGDRADQSRPDLFSLNSGVGELKASREDWTISSSDFGM